LTITSRLQLERYIKLNGHLVMEGDETVTDLREALLYLRQHTLRHCHRPELGTPIGVIVPDITELTGRSFGRIPVSKAEINSKYGKLL
jgi:hypothetical protein